MSAYIDVHLLFLFPLQLSYLPLVKCLKQDDNSFTMLPAYNGLHLKFIHMASVFHPLNFLTGHNIIRVLKNAVISGLERWLHS